MDAKMDSDVIISSSQWNESEITPDVIVNTEIKYVNEGGRAVGQTGGSITLKNRSRLSSSNHFLLKLGVTSL